MSFRGLLVNDVCFITETQRSTKGHKGGTTATSWGTPGATQSPAWHDVFNPRFCSPLWPSVLLCVFVIKKPRSRSPPWPSAVLSALRGEKAVRGIASPSGYCRSSCPIDGGTSVAMTWLTPTWQSRTAVPVKSLIINSLSEICLSRSSSAKGGFQW